MKELGECCHGCVPPERHLNCHSTCEKRRKELEEDAEKQKKIEAYRRKNAFAHYGNLKRWNKDKR